MEFPPPDNNRLQTRQIDSNYLGTDTANETSPYYDVHSSMLLRNKMQVQGREFDGAFIPCDVNMSL
jgi:hypothetical protein